MESTEMAEEYRRGALFFGMQDYITAARILAGVLAEDPGNLSVRLLLARSYYHSAQLGRAETELRRVLEQDPAEAYAHLLLARTLQRRNRPADAVPHLRMHAVMTGQF
jgi:cytochrome c-type biogenesis protein CcmH/NrfG